LPPLPKHADPAVDNDIQLVEKHQDIGIQQDDDIDNDVALMDPNHVIIP
jgi:hypothetical protein